MCVMILVLSPYHFPTPCATRAGLQRTYYRALYEKNLAVLHPRGKKACDGPSLMNVAMELRKCCNHPFLLRGVRDQVRSKREW